MKKKLFATVMAMVMAASLTACGSSSAGTTEAADTQAKTAALWIPEV